MKTKVFLITLIVTGLIFVKNLKAEVHEEQAGPVISGFIKDAANGEALIGATVYIKELGSGTVSNVYGFYSLSLAVGTYTIEYSFIGYQKVEKQVVVKDRQTINIELNSNSEVLSEVVINGQRSNENIVNQQMSSISLNAETMKRIPAFMGEVDVLKTMQLLPGVQTAAEGFSGFSVRGGLADHNLILLDEATVYNASHLMGFFSVFNSDAIKDMTIYKGDIPAQYGGRLASLLDIRMKEGNMKNFQATGGIGTISSRLTLEGPVIKDKASFLVSGRRTYADMFLALSSDSLLNDNQLYFYDLNMKGNYIIDQNNRLFLSGYFGRDIFAFRDFFNMEWGNATYTLRWNRLISDRLFANYSFIYSNYAYNMNLNTGGMSNFRWESGIEDYGVKADYNYYLNPNNTIRFGIQGIYHNIDPGHIIPNTGEEAIKMDNNKAIEYAVYLANDHKLSDRFSAQYGLRFSFAHNLGGGTVFKYDENYNVIDSTKYKRGAFYNLMPGLEPRLGATYLLRDDMSLKASYSRTYQYMQLASNSNAGMPTDVWFTASPNINPQYADQVAAGVFKNILNDRIELSAEVYYKDMKNQIDFKDNANIFFNDKLEAEIRTGVAKAYGVEFLVRKQRGQFTGWIAYTLSRSQRKIDEINNGNWYNTSTDKPHNLTLVANYEISKRLSIGANWVYTTGAPTTLPTGRWEYAGVIAPSYSERNGYRLPDYHRLDLSVNYRFNKNDNARFHNELNISCYNVYNRKNPFTIYFEPESRESHKMQAYALSMFGIVPAITWNFKF